MESPDSDEERKKMEMIKEPLLAMDNQKGGFRTIPFILVNEAFERLASYGLTPNMTLYLMNEYHMEVITGNTILLYWSAATNITPLLGAYLADSFVGRFWMIGFGSMFSFLGMILLWLTTMIPQARPPPCQESNLYGSNCSSPTTVQLILLCSSFAIMSIGAGGIRSSSIAFGADQLVKRENRNGGRALEKYFSWYIGLTTLSILVALTCVVYIQDHLGWKIGFGVPAVLMFLSIISFFLASSFYVKMKANKASLLTDLVQVIVASYRNRHMELPSQGTIQYCIKKGSTQVVPSEKLRFLNKACIIKDPQQDLMPEGIHTDSCSLCTVDQVEELKALLKVIPLWSTGVIMAINVSQPSFQILQASSMDRHITSTFEIPAGSFGMFTVISVVLWVALYDWLIIPLASRIMGKPVHLTTKQRMGIGIFLSILSMAMTAIIENIRRGIAIKQGYRDDPQAIVPMSALWLVLQNCLLGFAEALNTIGQNEFYFREFPRSMSSIASTIQGVGVCIANLLASLIFSTVDRITKTGGKPSWVSSNINEGHYDHYYWVLAGLSLVNMMYFLFCSWAYGPCEDGVGVWHEQDDTGDK